MDKNWVVLGRMRGLGFVELIFYFSFASRQIGFLRKASLKKCIYDIWRRSPVSALAEIPLGGLLGTKEFDQGGPRRRRGGILPEYY